jgi:hypothetical protein
MGEGEKNTIFSLENEDEDIKGDGDLLKHATEYHKTLFGPEINHNIPLDPELSGENEKLCADENDMLCKPFTVKEIEYALSQLEKNKAAGPDSIPIEFFQTCWDIVKDDIVELFNDFHAGRLNVNRLNYGIITLLPKVAWASRIQQYRPIFLSNCIYKWITKILTIRISPYAEKLISKEQTAFMKGRDIMSGVMALHEILHETKRKKKCGVILKLDFEKAYDKVSWSFLMECLRMKGFNGKWCGWIKQVVTGGTMSVKINDQVGPYFSSHKGVRQGDPYPQSYLTLWQIA